MHMAAQVAASQNGLSSMSDAMIREIVGLEARNSYK
jgi:hypothetical protein